MVNGFLLNNELTDFSFAPTDASGQPIANRVQPGKRPRSSMAPTLVFDKATGQFLLRSQDGSTRRLANKVRMALSAGQHVIVETPGAGGYGPPSERSAEAIAEDRVSGKSSTRYLASRYPESKT